MDRIEALRLKAEILRTVANAFPDDTDTAEALHCEADWSSNKARELMSCDKKLR